MLASGPHWHVLLAHGTSAWLAQQKVAGRCCLPHGGKAATQPTHGQAFLVAGGNCAASPHPCGVCPCQIPAAQRFRGHWREAYSRVWLY